MLRVTIEIVPYGSESHKKEIASLIITNNGTGDIYGGNYDIRLNKDGEEYTERIEGFPREAGALQLLARAIGKFKFKPARCPACLDTKRIAGLNQLGKIIEIGCPLC